MPASSNAALDAPLAAPRPSLLVRLVRLSAAIAIIGTVVSFFAAHYWIADIVSNLSVQFFAMLIPAAIRALRQRHKVKFAVLLAFISFHAIKLTPYCLPLNRQQAGVSVGKSHRLVIYNVLRTNEEFQQTLDTILSANADVLYLMEVQNAWEPYLKGVQDQYPYQKILAAPDYTGVALLSKHPWRELNVIALGYVSNPSIDAHIQFDQDENAELHLILTHPLPPFGNALTQSRDDQMISLAQRFRAGERRMLCGDFNLSPWSPRFAKLLQAGQLRDASLGFGLAPTLVPLPTWLGGVRVDHVLCNESVRVHDYQVQRTQNSDHAMVILDFSLLTTDVEPATVETKQ